MRGVVAARKLRAVVRIAEEAGVSRPDLLGAVGLGEDDLADVERLLPQRLWRDLWVEIVARCRDPAVGLRAAQRIDRGYFGVIDYVVRSCPTVAEAMKAAVRYFPLANTQGRLEIVARGELVAVERHLVGDEARFLPPQAAEFALAAMVQLFRDATSGAWRLERVTFRHVSPPHVAEHRRFFECPVDFGAEIDALIVRASALTLPMRAPDPSLRALVERHGDALLADLPVHFTVVDDVRRLLVRQLARGAGGADQIAAALGMSRRNLHRRLEDASTSFSAVRDELRRELAERYLRDSELVLGEIAMLLGYADASTFHRAFRAWHGEGPGAFRQRASRGAG